MGATSFNGLAQTSDLEWAKSIGGNSNGQAESIAVDANGNSYTAGRFGGTQDFDPGAGVFNMNASNGNSYLLKLDPNGNFIWAKNFGGTNSKPLSVKIDNSGNANVIGDYNNTGDFDPSAGVFNLTSLGSADVYVVQLDASGAFNWAATIGGTSIDNSSSIAVDDYNNIYTTGYFKGSMDCDPGAAVFNLNAAGAPLLYTDIFIQKMDQNGNFIWAKRLGGSRNDRAYAIHVQSPDTLYLTGEYTANVDFDLGPGTFNMNSGSDYDYDLFVLKMDGDANFEWARSMSGSSWDRGHDITTDVFGDALVVGYASGDVYVAKYDGNTGATVWSKTFGGSGSASDEGRAITSDAAGNVYVTGGVSGSGNIDLDPGAGVANFTTFSSVAYGIFIEKLDVNGDFIWAKVMSTSNEDMGRSIVLDNYESIYVAGYYYGIMDIDPGAPVTYFDAQFSPDGLIQKFQQCSPIATNQALTICGGTSITIGGNTHSTTGLYVDILSSVGGCDSVVTTDLTVSTEIVSAQAMTLCAGQSITVGSNTYSSTGTYIDVFTATSGCDSTVTTDLIVNAPISSSQTVSLCSGQSITVGSSTYSSTGNYIDVLTASNGCDSTVTTDLTVNSPVSSSQTVSLCSGQSVTVGSSTYSSTGVYVDVLTASNGCDSTVTTDLTVLQVNTSVTQVDNELTANEANVVYQWIDCSTSFAINGATSQTFTATSDGDYAVIVMSNGCSDTSTCYTVSGLGLNENDQLASFIVYPNPSQSEVFIDLGDFYDDVIVMVMDLSGKIISSEIFKHSKVIEQKLGQETGIYFLRIDTGDRTSIIRVLKN